MIWDILSTLGYLALAILSMLGYFFLREFARGMPGLGMPRPYRRNERDRRGPGA